MKRLKAWISAFRLRTLPLAVSAIAMGTFLADLYYEADMEILLLTLATAVCLQILSNLANDYGDFTKGTDNEQRLGNTRALQSGLIAPAQMLLAIVIFTGLSLGFGTWLLLTVTRGEINYAFLSFFLLGVAAIAAAIKYTMGKNPYGYSGLGDLFVFIFFGPVAVFGTFLLQGKFSFDLHSDWPVFIPTAAIGLLCAAVLNTNNIRDMANDEASGKRTIPVKTGLAKARNYHLLLVGGACTGMVAFLLLAPVSAWAWMACLAFVPLLRQVSQVYRTAPSPAFNPLLKQLSLSTLLMVLLLIAAEMAGNGFEVFSALNHHGH